MKKILLFVLAVVIIPIVITSCDKTKTEQELMNDEIKAIDHFISKNKLNILSQYPANGVFGEKDFYRTKEGLYMHVIDSGNGLRVLPYKEVLIRYKGALFFKTDTTSFSSKRDPDQFIYGNPNSYGQTSYSLTCTGVALPLSYVGANAQVSLIIPSALGISQANSKYWPLYIDTLIYRFDNK